MFCWKKEVPTANYRGERTHSSLVQTCANCCYTSDIRCPEFLSDLFFGDYEPEVYKISPELQQFNRAVEQARNLLAGDLSKVDCKGLDEYENALLKYNVAVTEQAYKAGV